MGGPPVASRSVRLARTEDADAIAAIQLTAWRTAYAGIMPAAFLAEQNVADRAERWRGRIGGAADPGSPTFVISDASDIRGFVHTGPIRDADLERRGRAELYTIYVHPTAWRRGLGSRLLQTVDDFWRPRRIGELVLWVFEANRPARAFYERKGWRHDGSTQVDDFGSAQAVEVRYRRALQPAESG